MPRAGGGASASGRGQEDPAELNAESLDPKLLVPPWEAGETPASGRLALPPFPFLPVPRGAGIARGAWGETRQVRSPLSRRRPLPPSSPPALGGAIVGPAPSAPARGPRRPAWPRDLGATPLLSFTFPLGQCTCGSLAHLCAQLRLQPNDVPTHPHLHFTFSLVASLSW